MKMKIFNNWKYKGKWMKNGTNLICCTYNEDFSGGKHIIFGMFGMMVFCYWNVDKEKK